MFLKTIQFLCLSLILFFNFGSEAHAKKRIKVVTSFTVLADMARNVAGEHADVVSVAKPGAEIHDYQPTPQDLVKAQDADIILWNGLNLELWFRRFLEDVDGAQSFVISTGIMPISITRGEYVGKPNPHAWMSSENAIVYIQNIRKALSKVDPENAENYARNAKIYKSKIANMRSELEDILSKIPKDKRYLVTSEGAFSYLAKDLNMTDIYIWPMNSDQQGSPRQVKNVIDKVRKNNIPVVFSESTVSDKPAKQVASETGALYGGVLYVDSLSEADGPVPTYLDLLRVTSQTIANGFREGLKAQQYGG